MKKVLVLILAILLLGLLGCSKEGNKEEGSAKEVTEETEQVGPVQPQADDEWGSPGQED